MMEEKRFTRLTGEMYLTHYKKGEKTVVARLNGTENMYLIDHHEDAELYCDNNTRAILCPDDHYLVGPIVETLHAYEELGYSPEELKKMIARRKDLEKTPATQPASRDDFKTTLVGHWITATNLPDPKPDPITKVYNMAQMEQYFTDRNIKVIRKWNKCGTDTRYTFTLTYAGVTQDYHFTYPDAVVYEERSKQMTKFCEGAYSCFDKYVRDRVRVTYMPARQNGKSLIEMAKAKMEMFNYVDTDISIQKRLYDMVLKGEAGFEDLYPSTMFAPGWPKKNPNINSSTPIIKDVIFNDPATIVFWNDGSKTVVRAHGGDKFDPEKGLAMAFAKKMFGNNHDYYLQFKRWLKKAKKGPESKKLEVE